MHSKTRQRLLFIAIAGLFLSSFSLLVLQSIMGGLQRGLIERSKKIVGSHILELSTEWPQTQNILAEIKRLEIPHLTEVEMEAIIKFGDLISPVVLHGVDLDGDIPFFLQGINFKGLALGDELAYVLKASRGDQLSLISPSHVDSFLGDVPRQVSDRLTDTVFTELSDVDRYHLWVRSGLIHNLMKSKSYNRVRLFQDVLPVELEKFLQPYREQVRMVSWESRNQSLVWALNLETNVMVILFVSMSLLLAISITSGFLIFFSKIRSDLLSFWILGYPREKVLRLIFYFGQGMSLLSCLGGLLVAILFLLALDRFGGNIMPAIFVERRIPVAITPKGLFISFTVPYLISFLFVAFSFQQFKKENRSFLKLLRSVG